MKSSLEDSCRFEHPWNRRPEFGQRHTPCRYGGFRHSVRTILRKPNSGFAGCESAMGSLQRRLVLFRLVQSSWQCRQAFFTKTHEPNYFIIPRDGRGDYCGFGVAVSEA